MWNPTDMILLEIKNKDKLVEVKEKVFPRYMASGVVYCFDKKYKTYYPYEESKGNRMLKFNSDKHL